MSALRMAPKSSTAGSLMIVYPYKECVSFLEALSPQIPVESLLVNGESLDDSLRNTLDDFLSRSCAPDAIIGRGIVTTYISQLFPSSPIIRIDPCPIDLMKPLEIARRRGDTVGILSYPDQDIEEHLEAMRNVFDFRRIELYPFRTGRDIDQQVSRAMHDGVHSLVGGGTYGLQRAESQQIPGTFVEISPTSVRKAIEQAVSVIRSRQKDRAQFEDIVTLANRASDGILLLRGSRIASCNAAVTDILGVVERQYLDKDVRNISSALADFVENSASDRGMLILNDREYAVERVKSRDETSSTIIILKDRARTRFRGRFGRGLVGRSQGQKARYKFDDIVGQSPSIAGAIRNGAIFAQSDADILIIGDSGTGKEMFAQSIHNHSLRNGMPFVALNCGAIPETLIESELFGYVDGAFTGARRGGKIGLFESAHGGTICLDEIDSLPLALQGKLLRVLQERLLRRVGSESETPIDVRIISCTNRDLLTMTRSSEFRSDLFYRISTLTLHIPALDQRGDDITCLADHFIDAYAAKYGKTVPTLSAAQKQLLKRRRWPGNVRELENLIHRYVILYSDLSNGWPPDGLEENDGNNPKNGPSGEVIAIRRGTLSEMEQHIITKYLDETRWNRKEAAKRLGISRTTLWRKLAES